MSAPSRVAPPDRRADARAPFRVPPFPLPARLGLGAWRALTRLGLPAPRFDEAALVAAAKRRTGLEDFGSEAFRTPMRRLLAAFDEEAALHLLGRAVLQSSVVRALECRLRLERIRAVDPALEATPVRAPVFITGMQRTGTTKLHRLLACAPELRHLSSAEGLNPCPLGLPVRDEPGEAERRMAFAKRAERGMRYMSPALFAIHPIEADAPEEDVFLFDVTFISPAVDASLSVPSYTRWIREIDQRPPYAYVRRLIQCLLWQAPVPPRPGARPAQRYLGKTPHHQENLDVLFDVFPDAKVIHTHRDPLEVVPSFSSMMAHAGAMLSSRVDPFEVGRRVADQMTNSVERAIAARAKVGSGRVLDVRYRDLQRDPIGELRRIHAFAELEWNGESEARAKRWLDGNPQHKYGTHRYGLADFGLDAEELAARFKPYRERFGVESRMG
ncbi:MAG: sulfotransferase [Myxococcota bacterium]